MEKQKHVDDVSSTDMQSNNLILKVYDIFLESSRSLLKFNGEQLDEINIYIYNDSIRKIFQFLNTINFFSKNANYEICCNEFNCSIIIIGEFNIQHLEYCNLTYYQINDNVIIDKKFNDWYGILKNSKTFTQRDDNIRKNIHSLLIKEVPVNSQIIFIGGEMYVYAKILNYIKGIAFTDYESIKQITEENNQIPTYLINYDINIIFPHLLSNDINPNICIINVLDGLSKNLAKQINSLNINKLIIISCKLKTLNSDKKLINMDLYEVYNLKTSCQHIVLSIYTKKILHT
jgi:hypothetical protein